jgi:hypothetical protein
MVNSRIDSPDLPFAGSPSLQLRWKEGLFLSKRHCERSVAIPDEQSGSVF